MKKIAALLLVSVLAACSNTDEKDENATADTAQVQAPMFAPPKDTTQVSADGTYCFVNAHGKDNKDTIAVKMILAGDKVTGKMAIMPYQKDRAIGNITAIKKGDTVEVNTVVAILDGADGATAAPPKAPAEEPKQAAPPPAPGSR